MQNPAISVVIPVLRDTAAATRLVGSIPAEAPVEVILVDGGDDPALLALERHGVRIVRSAPGRGNQMNAGAAASSADWIFFLHADSQLPAGWLDALLGVPAETLGGWFRFALDARAWQARLVEWGVRWRVRLFRLPYGDQGIFVRRVTFQALGGYDPIPLLEDVAFVRRLVAAGPVLEVPLPLVTSARRWERDGWFSHSARNLAIITGYFAGLSPTRLSRWYERR